MFNNKIKIANHPLLEKIGQGVERSLDKTHETDECQTEAYELGAEKGMLQCWNWENE